jgi:hypothetical protein
MTRLSRGAAFAQAVGGYVPNVVAASARFWYVLMFMVCMAYAIYGFYNGRMVLPSLSRRGSGLWLHGLPAAIMGGAMLVGAAHFISLVIDHHDKRNNQASYARFARRTKWLFWILFAAALIVRQALKRSA